MRGRRQLCGGAAGGGADGVLCAGYVCVRGGRADRSGATRVLGDAVLVLLENRPAAPYAALAAHFAAAAGGRDGGTPLMQAHRMLRLAHHSHEAFGPNVAAAYALLAQAPVAGVAPVLAGGVFMKLVRLLCAGMPVDVMRYVLELLERDDAQAVGHAEFEAAVRGCLCIEAFVEELEDAHREAAAAAPDGKARAVDVAPIVERLERECAALGKPWRAADGAAVPPAWKEFCVALVRQQL